MLKIFTQKYNLQTIIFKKLKMRKESSQIYESHQITYQKNGNYEIIIYVTIDLLTLEFCYLLSILIILVSSLSIREFQQFLLIPILHDPFLPKSILNLVIKGLVIRLIFIIVVITEFSVILRLSFLTPSIIPNTSLFLFINILTLFQLPQVDRQLPNQYHFLITKIQAF